MSYDGQERRADYSINGVPYANVKTINGTAVASVKKFNKEAFRKWI